MTIDVKTFWQTLGERATGMTIVTADSDQGPTGFIGLSAAHVTATPPTMLVSIDRQTSALEGVLARRHFAINFLPAEAQELVALFSGKSDVSGASRFAPHDWITLATGAPILRSALGAFDCTVDSVIERETVVVVIGAVQAVQARGEGAPLLFFRGKTIMNVNP